MGLQNIGFGLVGLQNIGVDLWACEISIVTYHKISLVFVVQVDLIAIDFSEKLPFRLKQPLVKVAIEVS